MSDMNGNVKWVSDDKKITIRCNYEVAQDKEQLTSTVTCDLYMVTDLDVNIPSQTHIVTIGGTAQYINSSIIGTGEIHIGRTSKVLYHNANGTCDAYDMRFNIAVNSVLGGVKYDTIAIWGYYHTVEPLPAPATITLDKTSCCVGNQLIININKAFDDYTVDLEYTFFDSSGYIEQKYKPKKSYWTIPLLLAEQIPNLTSGICSVRCVTYDENGQRLGSSQSSFTLTIDDTLAPTLDFRVLSDIAEETTTFICNLSNINIIGKALGQYGATIKSVNAKVGGLRNSFATYNKSWIGDPDSTFYGYGTIIDKSGQIPVEVTCSDSRGFTTTKTITVDFIDYCNLTLDSCTVKRCDTNGNLEDEGDNALVQINGRVSATLNNTYAAKIRYKPTGATDKLSWKTVEVKGTSGIYEFNISKVIKGIEATKSYNFEIIVNDTLDEYKRTTYKIILDCNNVDIDFYGKGTGIAFGGVATEPGIADFFMPIKARKGFEPVDFEYSDFNKFVDEGTFVSGNGATTGGISHAPAYEGVGQSILIVHLSSVQKSKNGDYYKKTIHQTLIRVSEKTGISSRTPTGVEVWFRTGYYGVNVIDGYNWDSWRPLIRTTDRVLWKGAYYMTGNHTANLSESISAQPNGAALVFSTYDIENNTPNEYGWQIFYIPKSMVPLTSAGYQFTLTWGDFNYIGRKYLYIRDKSILGNDNNKNKGTNSGITYDNSRFVLRYVIGF